MSEIILRVNLPNGESNSVKKRLLSLIEVDVRKARIEKEVAELLKTIRPGFGGKASSKELDEYADEVYGV
ncbi:hypothetical protein [Thermococcus sp. ES12]|uniref:hypothetical protein n=1 Tax=Thermococcus sp. ES12 TaxID=1638246 RepID=UPI0014309D40|nr:hypothetical protein [Thermococcus sp. ES12]NJE76904.1 hypothetical protein [Thermococcus sp. ES12]